MLSFYGLAALQHTLERINPTQFGLAVMTACPVKFRKPKHNPFTGHDVRLVKVDVGWDFANYANRVQGSTASLSGCTDLEYNAKPTWHIPANEDGSLPMVRKNRNKDDGKRYLAMCSRVDRKGVLDGSFFLIDGKLADDDQVAAIREWEVVSEHKGSNPQLEQGVKAEFATIEKVVDVANLVGIFLDHKSATAALAEIRSVSR